MKWDINIEMRSKGSCKMLHRPKWRITSLGEMDLGAVVNCRLHVCQQCDAAKKCNVGLC